MINIPKVEAIRHGYINFYLPFLLSKVPFISPVKSKFLGLVITLIHCP